MLRNIWQNLFISFCISAGLGSIFANEEGIFKMDEEDSFSEEKKYVFTRRVKEDPFHEEKIILFKRQKENIQSLFEPCPETEKWLLAQRFFFISGFCYEKMEEFNKAEMHYKIAANNGHIEAQRNLGILCMDFGDIFAAMMYLKLAACQGDASAQYNLAVLFESEENIPKASKYCRLAANQGHEDARILLRQIRRQEKERSQVKAALT